MNRFINLLDTKLYCHPDSQWGAVVYTFMGSSGMNVNGTPHFHILSWGLVEKFCSAILATSFHFVAPQITFRRFRKRACPTPCGSLAFTSIKEWIREVSNSSILACQKLFLKYEVHLHMLGTT